MQIVSLGDNLHEMSKPIFWERNKEDISLSSAEWQWLKDTICSDAKQVRHPLWRFRALENQILSCLSGLPLHRKIKLLSFKGVLISVKSCYWNSRNKIITFNKRAGYTW